MDINSIFKLIDDKKQELFELLCSFVRINSENYVSYGNEQAMAEVIHKICLDIGLESDMYSPMSIKDFDKHPDYLPGRNLENRYNVTARWKGATDSDELMLMGHTDTVEIGDVANWDFEPLCGEVRDGKILGRGVGDDKYALAVVIFLIKLLKEAGFKPKANLLFSAYSDEEHGGSHGALAAVLKYPCPHIVNMDGRDDQIWHCGSGGQEVFYTYHTDDTVDSAEAAARAIPLVLDEIKTFANNRCKELEANRFYAGTIIPSTSLRYMGINAGDRGADLGVGKICFVYYTDKTWTEIESELSRLHKVINSKLKPLGITGDGFKPRTRFFHYVHCEPDSPDILTMLEASREATGQEPIVCGSCLSDLSVISKFGSSSAYGFGAGRDFSTVGGAHQPNEFIECDKLVDYAKTIAAYVLKVLG